MRKNNFLEDLREYFKNTPREQVIKDWEESENLDKVGPTVDEFLTHMNHYNDGVEDVGDLNLLLSELKEDYINGRVRDWVGLNEWIETIDEKSLQFGELTKDNVVSMLYKSFSELRINYKL